MQELAKIIGVNKEYSMIIIGFGNIGHALFQYSGFKTLDYNVKAVFDKNNEEVSTENLKVLSTDDLKEYLEKNEIDIGIITTPKDGAQEVCDILCEGGIKGIWNFAPVDLKTKNNVVIENVHLDESLFTLTYFINTPEDFIF